MRSSYSGKVMGPKISSWTLPRMFMPAPWITRILSIDSSVVSSLSNQSVAPAVVDEGVRGAGWRLCAGRAGRRHDHEERHNYWKPQAFVPPKEAEYAVGHERCHAENPGGRRQHRCPVRARPV